MSTTNTPQVVLRPKLAHWMFERGLQPKDAVEPLGVRVEAVRRYCLPFGDPLRRIPRQEIMARIVAWTGGAVGPADFYEPASAEPAE